MAGIKFELEYPNAKLSPNARTHYMQKANITKKARGDTKLIALSAGAGSLDKTGVQIRVSFYPSTNRRRDEDNVIGAFKAYRDGIADALGVDDADIEFDYKLLKETRKGGVTVVQINSGCKTCIRCGQYLQIDKSQWQNGKTAPKTGEQFLADIGYPWAVIAMYSEADEEFVYADIESSLYEGRNDPYFITEHEKPGNIKRWRPMPKL